MRQRTLSDYASERGVAYFADWPYNLMTFSKLSERARNTPMIMERIGAAKAQGEDRFEVSRVVWPMTSP